MDAQRLDDQKELIYNSSVWTQEVVYETCQKLWKIKTNGKRESGEIRASSVM